MPRAASDDPRTRAVALVKRAYHEADSALDKDAEALPLVALARQDLESALQILNYLEKQATSAK